MVKRIAVFVEGRADGGPLESIINRLHEAEQDHNRGIDVSVVRRIGGEWNYHSFDILVVLGDREAALHNALFATKLGKAIAHIHGGEISGGRDEAYRHCITKLAHIHFAATEKAAERIRRMGENPEHIHVVGAPGLDDLPRFDEPRTDEILVCMHPNSCKSESENERALWAVLTATNSFNRVLLMPNCDPGGSEMRRVAQQFGAIENLPRREYLRKLATCACAVGNSSSFLIEAPFYGTPVVLVGDRQKGREKADCVVHADAVSEDINFAIDWCASRERMQVVGHKSSGLPTNNPYGDGHASERIVQILEDLDLSTVPVQKEWFE